jgi:hypothetical protein
MANLIKLTNGERRYNLDFALFFYFGETLSEIASVGGSTAHRWYKASKIILIGVTQLKSARAENKGLS